MACGSNAKRLLYHIASIKSVLRKAAPLNTCSYILFQKHLCPLLLTRFSNQQTASFQAPWRVCSSLGHLLKWSLSVLNRNRIKSSPLDLTYRSRGQQKFEVSTSISVANRNPAMEHFDVVGCTCALLHILLRLNHTKTRQENFSFKTFSRLGFLLLRDLINWVTNLAALGQRRTCQGSYRQGTSEWFNFKPRQLSVKHRETDIFKNSTLSMVWKVHGFQWWRRANNIYLQVLEVPGLAFQI